MNSFPKCFNVDWLSIYCICTENDFFEINKAHPLFYIQKLEYGTPQFINAGLIFDKRTKRNIAHVQWSPRAKILTENAVIIKFANSVLYNTNLFDTIEEVLSMSLTFKSISRIDLALDFQTFDNGWKPYDLILKFLCKEVRRKGHGKFSIYGEQGNNGLKYTGIQFGSKSSAVNVYMYNKTLELDSVKDKPHIRECWRLAGFDTSQDVWRLELSCKPEALIFEDKKSGSDVDFTHYKSINDAPVLFWCYIDKFFCFTDPLSDCNVSRQKIIQLFNEKPCIERKVLNFHNCSNVSDRIFIKKLFNVGQYVFVDDFDKLQADLIMSDVVKSCRLSQWFNKKRRYWEKTQRVME